MLTLQNTTFEQLDDRFFRPSQPDKIEQPELILFNHELAEFLNLPTTELSLTDLAETFAGNQLVNTNPIALVYAGHQFGQFVPQLGDGRAVLLGDILAKDDRRYDIQLKGSGQTEFSRNGDGKSALGPVIREYIVSEAMYALGVPTTRALAAVATNESVYRQNGPEPAGIFTRVARAHIRIGTFEFYASRRMVTELKQLADYTIERLYPELKEADNPYVALFSRVSEGILKLVAKWQSIGFIHGVMNTDNMSLAAETIDYGPCAFMDTYSADKVFSSIDRNGRYAYNQQQNIAQWNLSVLASCLIPLIDKDEKKAVSQLQSVMDQLPARYEEFWLAEFRPKLGLFNALPQDKLLIEQILKEFEDTASDFTNGFWSLPDNLSHAHKARLALQPESLQQAKTLMRQTNPWLIPRNHQIEKAIQQAYQGDYQHFIRLTDAYKSPFETCNDFQDLTVPPAAHEVVRRTFCGT